MAAVKSNVKSFINSAKWNLDSALEELAAPGETRPPDKPDDPPPDESLEGKPRGHFVVGKGEAAPGKIAVVEVLGGTNFETNGFSLGIGVEPDLSLVKGEPSLELKDLLGIDSPQAIVKQQKRSDWYEQFVQMSVFFFNSLGDLLSIDPNAPPSKPTGSGLEIVNVMVPQMTPLFLLHFKVPEASGPGDKLNLDIELVYGRKLLDSSGPIKQIDHPAMWTTRRDVAQTGIYPGEEDRVSGWIRVVAP